MFAATDHDEILEETKRDVMAQCIAHHIGLENTVVLGLGDDHAMQVFKQAFGAVDRAQVKPDRT